MWLMGMRLLYGNFGKVDYIHDGISFITIHINQTKMDYIHDGIRFNIIRIKQTVE